jgi:hypothetical protein
VDPAYVVTAICRSALVGHNCHKLIVSGIQSLSMGSVEVLIGKFIF